MDKNSTVIFPAPLMSTIQELGAFLTRGAVAETLAAASTSQGRRARPACILRTQRRGLLKSRPSDPCPFSGWRPEAVSPGARPKDIRRACRQRSR